MLDEVARAPSELTAKDTAAIVAVVARPAIASDFATGGVVAWRIKDSKQRPCRGKCGWGWGICE